MGKRIKERKYGNYNLSGKEIFILIFWVIPLFVLFLLKYIFPVNEFVQEYFTGLYQFGFIILYFILGWKFGPKRRASNEK